MKKKEKIVTNNWTVPISMELPHFIAHDEGTNHCTSNIILISYEKDISIQPQIQSALTYNPSK